MTEWETTQHIHAFTEHLIALQDAQASYIAIYLSGIFAFLLAAHSAGIKMTRFQVTISNLIFSLFAFVIGVRIIAYGVGINEMMLDISDIQGASTLARYQILDPSLRQTIAVIVWSVGPIAALAFMWSVRHPRTE